VLTHGFSQLPRARQRDSAGAGSGSPGQARDSRHLEAATAATTTSRSGAPTPAAAAPSARNGSAMPRARLAVAELGRLTAAEAGTDSARAAVPGRFRHHVRADEPTPSSP
jgi:hypothetical protein